jgi:hypothetical protein
MVKKFTGHSREVRALAYSPDGGQLLSGGADAMLLLWDVVGQRVAEQDLSDAQLESLWQDLADSNSGLADAATEALSRNPQLALKQFRAKLRGAADPNPADVPRLIEALRDDNEKKREDAAAKLRTYGDKASAEIFQALKSSNARVRGELEELLAAIDASPTPPEQLRRSRSIAILERIGSDDAKGQLQALIDAAPQSTTAKEAQAALDRLKTRRNPPKASIAPGK